MGEPGRVGHSRPVLCPLPNSLTQVHYLPLTFSVPRWIPSPLKVTGNHLFPLPFNILFLASPLHLYVTAVFYSITLLSIFYHHFLCCTSVPGEIPHQPQRWEVVGKKHQTDSELRLGVEVPVGSYPSVGIFVTGTSTQAFSASGSHQAGN